MCGENITYWYLKTLAPKKLTIKCKQKQFGYEELTDLDLMKHCSNGTLLQSCDGTNMFFYECQKLRYYSKHEELKKSD